MYHRYPYRDASGLRNRLNGKKILRKPSKYDVGNIHSRWNGDNDRAGMRTSEVACNKPCTSNMPSVARSDLALRRRSRPHQIAYSTQEA